MPFYYAEHHVQAEASKAAQAILKILAVADDKQLTHRERNHINTVVKLLTENIADLVKPDIVLHDANNIPF